MTMRQASVHGYMTGIWSYNLLWWSSLIIALMSHGYEAVIHPWLHDWNVVMQPSVISLVWLQPKGHMTMKQSIILGYMTGMWSCNLLWLQWFDYSNQTTWLWGRHLSMVIWLEYGHTTFCDCSSLIIETVGLGAKRRLRSIYGTKAV
jgi:hypothetical protein